MQISEQTFKVIVKPNKKENKLLGFNKEKQAYILEIKEKPENNKANREIIKFLSKTLKKQVTIRKGLKSREKIITLN